MSQTLQPAPTRRRLVAWLALGAIGAVAAPAVQAQSILYNPPMFDGLRDRGDPADRIPRWYSLRRFTSLSENQIYQVNRAIKRHRTVIIEGYSRSQSRDIIRSAARDWPATRAQLLRNQ